MQNRWSALRRSEIVILLLAICSLTLPQPLRGQVPQLINYQGRVLVGTTGFNGIGQFKFALVNAAGTTAYWTNDGTHLDGTQPTQAVSLNVTSGLYSVLLGDTSLSNMTTVPATVFNNPDVRLRVWFNDGIHGWERLTPDQRIAAVGYAMIADNVSDGAITSAKMANGAIGSAQLASGAVTSAKIDTTTVQRRITGSAPTGQFIKSINADGTIVAGAASGGTVTAVATGSGLTGGPITGAGTIAVDNTIPRLGLSNTFFDPTKKQLIGAASPPEKASTAFKAGAQLEISSRSTDLQVPFAVYGKYRSGTSGDRYVTAISNDLGIYSNAYITLDGINGGGIGGSNMLTINSDVTHALVIFNGAGTGSYLAEFYGVPNNAARMEKVFEVTDKGQMTLTNPYGASGAANQQNPQLAILDTAATSTAPTVGMAFRQLNGVANIGTYLPATNTQDSQIQITRGTPNQVLINGALVTISTNFYSGKHYFGGAVNNNYLGFNGSSYIFGIGSGTPTANIIPAVDGHLNLGTSTSRFASLNLSGNATVGGTVRASNLPVGMITKFKNTAQNFTGTTSFADDSDLQIAVNNGEVWQFRFTIRGRSNAPSSGLKLAFSYPPIVWSVLSSAMVLQGSSNYNNYPSPDLPGSDRAIWIRDNGVDDMVFDGTVNVKFSATGTFKVRGAQNTSSAASGSFAAGSTLIGVRLQ